MRWTRLSRGRLRDWLVDFYKLWVDESSASMVLLGLSGAHMSFLLLFLVMVLFWRHYRYSWNNHALDGLFVPTPSGSDVLLVTWVSCIELTGLWLEPGPCASVPWMSPYGLSWLDPNTNSGELVTLDAC